MGWDAINHLLKSIRDRPETRLTPEALRTCRLRDRPGARRPDGDTSHEGGRPPAGSGRAGSELLQVEAVSAGGTEEMSAGGTDHLALHLHVRLLLLVLVQAGRLRGGALREERGLRAMCFSSPYLEMGDESHEFFIPHLEMGDESFIPYLEIGDIRKNTYIPCLEIGDANPASLISKWGIKMKMFHPRSRDEI